MAAVGLVGVLGLVVALAWNQLAAMWYANLGSVEQTRYELARYSFPEQLVEYTRRDCKSGISDFRFQISNCELGEAEGDFERALALDGGNVTANQRLAEIDLAQGQYEQAQSYTEAAFRRDPGNVVTWQVLGDAYLAMGKMDEAYALWSQVPDAKSRLGIEADVRYAKNGDLERAAWVKELVGRIP